jgi:threonine synthase
VVAVDGNFDAALELVKEACAAHPIHCRVAADGATFTLSVPAQSHEQAFATRSK